MYLSSETWHLPGAELDSSCFIADVLCLVTRCCDFGEVFSDAVGNMKIS